MIRVDFVEYELYLLVEKTRGKIFQNGIEMYFLKRVKGDKKIVHFLFKSVRGGWILSLSDRQIMDYTITKWQHD